MFTSAGVTSLPRRQAWSHFPNARSTTCERGNDFQGWAFFYRRWYSLHDCHHSCPLPRISDDVSSSTHTAVPHQNFRLPKPKARYPSLPSARSLTREKGNDYHGWAIFTDGGTRVVDGETLAGWGVIARSPHERIDIMFGPVVTTEAHRAFSGARTHSNDTAEMSAMIEALSFLGPHGPVAQDVESCFFFFFLKILNTLLEFVWARSKPAHMCSWHSHVNGP